MDNRVLNTITQYDSLILSMKLYYSHTDNFRSAGIELLGKKRNMGVF